MLMSCRRLAEQERRAHTQEERLDGLFKAVGRLDARVRGIVKVMGDEGNEKHYERPG
jgi:hypothetical protein